MMRWRPAHALIGIGIAVVLAGCAAAPKDLQRWVNQTGVDDWAPPYFIVSAQSSAEPASQMSVRNLPDHAAATYIAEAAAWMKKKDPDELRQFLTKPIASGDSSHLDQTRLGRVLVVDVERTTVRPGDRYVATLVEVQPSVGGDGRPLYEFVDYQIASTDFSTINLGSINISHQVAESLQLTPTIGAAASPTASLGAATTNTSAATRNVTDRSELSVSVTPARVTVVRRGAEGIDLVGNTLIKLGIQFQEGATEVIYLAASDLFNDDGTPKTADKAELKVVSVERPRLEMAYLCAKLKYTDRSIDSGREFLDEGRQTVSYRHDTAASWQAFPVATSEELRGASWILTGRNTALTVSLGAFQYPLAFASYTAADQFRAWLRVRRANVIGAMKARLVTGDGKGGWEPWYEYDDLKVVRNRPGAGSPAKACPG